MFSFRKSKFVFFIFLVFSFVTIGFSQTNNTAGISLTFDINTSPTYDSTPISISLPNSITYDSIDLLGEYISFNVGYPSNLYDTKVMIYDGLGDESTKQCESSYSSNDFGICSFNYSSLDISESNKFYAYTCNDMDDCSLSYSFVFGLFDTISAGIELTSVSNTSSSYSSRPVSFTPVIDVGIINLDLGNEDITFGVSHNSNLYDTKVMIYDDKGIFSNVLCETSFDSNTTNFCSFNYNGLDISESNPFYAYTCSSYFDCSLSYSFIFGLDDTVSAGIDLDIVQHFERPPAPVYVTPTPIDGSKLGNIDDLSILVYHEGLNVTSCRIEVNNVSDTMIYNSTHCSYDLNISLSEVITDVNFQSFYTILGAESPMDEREIKLYSSLASIKYPSFGFGSILAMTLLIVIGFLF